MKNSLFSPEQLASMGISSSAGGPATPGAAGTPGKSVFTPEQMASLGIEQGASSPSRGRSDAPAARTPGTTPAQPVKITLQTPEGEPVQLPTSERLSRRVATCLRRLQRLHHRCHWS